MNSGVPTLKLQGVGATKSVTLRRGAKAFAPVTDSEAGKAAAGHHEPCLTRRANPLFAERASPYTAPSKATSVGPTGKSHRYAM